MSVDAAEGTDVLLRVEHVSATVGDRPRRRGHRPHRSVTIVDDVSFSLGTGQTLGIVGESGCGKSTLANTVLQLHHAAGGSVVFDGVELIGLTGRRLSEARRQIQMVFQDPHSSLDPRMTVRELVEEPLRNYGLVDSGGSEAQLLELLDAVGLSADTLDRRPRQLSGGQAQRVAIARALPSQPKLLILDEAVSSLDVSVRAQVLNMLVRLSEQRHLSYLFIAHDLAAVSFVSDVIAIMYLGKICEIGPTEAVLRRNGHPYTNLLVASDPRQIVAGATAPAGGDDEVPSVFSRSPGCPFVARCPEAEDIRRHEPPALREIDHQQWVACHFRPGMPAPVDATAPRRPTTR
jgi:peptide/nickel transport system ATP-binding protein